MPKKILIIGGGFTGLTVAWKLAGDKNFSLTLVESAGQLGGLAAGFPLGGAFLEKTYHHLFLTDTAILDLVRELGLYIYDPTKPESEEPLKKDDHAPDSLRYLITGLDRRHAIKPIPRKPIDHELYNLANWE